MKHLEHAPLYVASGVRIDWSRLGVFDDDNAAVCEGERAQGGDDADDIDTDPENIDLDDLVQLAIALNAMSKTIFFNEEGDQRPRALLMRDDGERRGELDDATAADKLIDQSHSLHLTPDENRVPLALFMDAYAEEFTFPTIYMGVPRKIIGPRFTPFAMAIRHGQQQDTAHRLVWSNAGARLVHGREASSHLFSVDDMPAMTAPATQQQRDACAGDAPSVDGAVASDGENFVGFYDSTCSVSFSVESDEGTA
ncbi:hypothetical protein MRX96_001848 [Rhipicephalus microplus]